MTALAPQWLQDLFSTLRGRVRSRTAFGGDPNAPVGVFTAANAMEGELVRALLESEGVPAYVGGTALSDVYGLQVGPLARVQVYAPRSVASRAQQIIAERHLRPEMNVEWLEEAWEEEDDGGDEA